MFPFSLYYIICCSCILKDRCLKMMLNPEGKSIVYFTVLCIFKTYCGII